MTKEELIRGIQNISHSTVDLSSKSNEETFYDSKNQKWSAAVNYAHLTLSAKLLARGLAAPKIALWLKFGRKSTPSSVSYDEIVSKYIEVNSQPREALTGFEPKMIPNTSKTFELDAFLKMHEKLVKILDSWSEKQLDTYLVPHPLMGKITVREMLQFMIYHIGHHQKAIQISLN